MALKTKQDFAVQASNIFDAMTHSFNDHQKADLLRFFLSTITARIATTFIISHYLAEKKLSPSCVYEKLSPTYGSKSSFVNFVALGNKKGYLFLISDKEDKRRKYLYPSPSFVKVWCEFLAKTKGVEIATDVEWEKILEKATDISSK
tara:strand:+ start:124 stop:564 length:441 start_codon:yes stop_codon:yes gene_type:complete